MIIQQVRNIKALSEQQAKEINGNGGGMPPTIPPYRLAAFESSADMMDGGDDFTNTTLSIGN